MFVTVVAVMCHLVTAQVTIAPDRDCTSEEARVEEIVTSSEMDDALTFQGCMIGQPQVAKWKGEHPIYAKSGWRVARIKCAPGRYEIRGAA